MYIENFLENSENEQKYQIDKKNKYPEKIQHESENSEYLEPYDDLNGHTDTKSNNHIQEISECLEEESSCNIDKFISPEIKRTLNINNKRTNDQIEQILSQNYLMQ